MCVCEREEHLCVTVCVSLTLTIDQNILCLALMRPQLRNLMTMTAIPRKISRMDTAMPVPAAA